METMQPVLKRGRDVWDKINMPKSEFQQRVEKIKKQMKKEGIDVLLIYGHGQNEYGNPCYISNYIVKVLRGVLIAITKKGEATLFVRISSRDVEDAKSTTWVEDVRSCGDVSQASVTYLKEKNLIPSTIGLIGIQQFMPNYQLQFLSKSLEQCNIVDADHILRDMRMVKSQRECDQIRRSARIVADAFSLIPDYLFQNTNEMILEALIDREARLEGAEDVRILIAKPKDTEWAFRPAEDMQISPGETVIIYLAIEFERYWSEGIRTFLAKDSCLVELHSEKVIALYDQVMGGLKPGKKLSRFYKETIGKIRKSNVNGIQEYGLGQGIGLSLQEFPVITEGDESLLKKGMCLTLRLAIQDDEMGPVMVGNTIHVAKDGPEVLTK